MGICCVSTLYLEWLVVGVVSNCDLVRAECLVCRLYIHVVFILSLIHSWYYIHISIWLEHNVIAIRLSGQFAVYTYLTNVIEPHVNNSTLQLKENLTRPTQLAVMYLTV